MTTEEIPLKGGIANAGAVVRVGDTVRRPVAPQMAAVHNFMTHLRAQGCTFVPEPLGVDDQGREILSWIPGQAAAEPWPDWMASEPLLVAVAQTQASIHAAASSFEPAADANWAATAGDYFPDGSAGLLVCHNDLSATNVIVDPAAESVVGVIDWDFAAPVDPLFDIMVTARHWLPFAPPKWRVDCLKDADVGARFALFANTHGLSSDDRSRVFTMAAAFIEQAGRNIVRLAATAGPDSGYQALLDRGYLQSIDDTLAWLPTL